MILDNSELTEKIKTFLRFKAKEGENFNKLNSKIFSFQKENGEFINNIERMIN